MNSFVGKRYGHSVANNELSISTRAPEHRSIPPKRTTELRTAFVWSSMVANAHESLSMFASIHPDKPYWGGLRMTSVFRHWLVSCFVSSLLAAAVLLIGLTYSSSAEAQQRTFYLDRLQIGGSPNDTLALWRPRMKQETTFFGQFALGWQHRPLRGETVAYSDRVANQTPNPVQNQITTYLTAGVELLTRMSFSVSLPVVLYQHGDGSCPRNAGTGCDTSDADPIVPSDTRIDLRGIVYRSKNDKFHFGAAVNVWIPSGAEYSFTSDDSVTAALRLLLEYDIGAVVLTGNTGVQYRPNRGLNRLRMGSEWFWGVGAFAPLRNDTLRIGGAIFGSTGIVDAGTTTIARDGNTVFTKRNTPIEWMGELRFALDKNKAAWFGAGAGTRLANAYGNPDVRVLASLGYGFSIRDSEVKSPHKRYRAEDIPPPSSSDRDGDGIPDDLDLCPDEPEDGKEPDPSDGCPAASDRDGDGIPDDVDECPDEPEDFDGLADEDGCPEDDFDHDGIPDTEDACPREPGVANDDPAQHGCPKFIRRVEGSTEIQILKRVEFATGSAVLLPQSFPILDEVLALLNANQDIKKVGIEGHTDNRGGRDMNMRLSQSRAESVMKYLVDKGIISGRLTAKGHGYDRPIDTNDTADGRQRNRRVEFHILEQDN